MQRRVRFVKDINFISFYTEFLFMMAAKRSNKKWQDGDIEKPIDLYEEIKDRKCKNFSFV